jgi:ABC-type multidrug transport system fused ATPase/permease subunit
MESLQIRHMFNKFNASQPCNKMFSRLILFLLIALLSFLLQLFLPWWIIAIVAFGAALWKATTGNTAFWSGFLAIVLVWMLMATVIHVRTDGILTERIAALLGLPASFLLIVVTALAGGIVGGMAALSGYYMRQLIR